MAEKNRLQRLTDVLIGINDGTPKISTGVKSVTYNISPSNKVLYSTDSKEDRDAKLKLAKQQHLLSHMWAKTGVETSMEQLPGATQVRVMYRDADLMAAWPEIGAALDIIAEESTTINSKGKMLNIYSKSERIKSILEDLFVNRLEINVWARTIFRAAAKYGNDFMFLNIDAKRGILGWRELPVHEMTRVENCLTYGYGMAIPSYLNLKPDEVKFVWEGHNDGIPFQSWQVAHFRLINDSLFLPYGVSWLNKVRRHWRILSMMEDGMLLYRLERSIERRVFKVNVGLIDDADVPAFLQEFMNGIKRAPIIDPQTGQVDLRKNFLDVSADYVIPVRNGQDPSSIDNLPSATNATSMDDIKYVENKVLCGLRVPKTFLNFQEPQGKGQNLSILDIRFNRAINAIQQAILMELNKIATIHLYLLGFEDDLTNFTLSFNNPSNQIEIMELDNLTKRLGAASAALAEQGGGIPLMSWHQVQKEIMGKTDPEIADLLDEIRLEAAISIELQRTPEIIRRTHMFDRVDRIYGEPGAKYSPGIPGQDEMGGGLGGGGGAPMGGGFGDELGDLGEPGSDDFGDIGGDEGSENLENMGGGDEGGAAPLQEQVVRRAKKAFNEAVSKRIISLSEQDFYKEYLKKFNVNESENRRVDITDKALLISETIDRTMKELDDMVKREPKKENEEEIEISEE